MHLKVPDGSSSDFHYDWVLREVGKITAGKKILDFGSGMGNFLKKLEIFGNLQLYAVDNSIRPDGLNPNIQWKSQDLNKPNLSDWEQTFDYIFAIEVIEHLENPRETVRLLNRLLAPNGTLIITTPNPASFRSILSLVFRGHFVDFLDNSYPAHITAILPLDMKRVLNENNLKFDLRYSNRGNLPSYTSLTWQQISLGLLRGSCFSDHYLVRINRE